MTTPTIIRSNPGIKRDGTQFDGDYYTDGQWCRFQRGLPRKMGGYRATSSRIQEPVYGMSSFSQNGNQYLHLGEESFLEQAVIDATTGNLSSLNDRTPVGFSTDPNNLWQFANLPSAVAATATDLIAHAAPNLDDISSDTETPIYYGQADLTTPLIDTGLDSVSGGVAAIGPYTVGFGSGGVILWSDPNDPTTQENRARITGQKIVRVLPVRAGQSGPAMLVWSLDFLIQGVFVAGATGGSGDPIFAFVDLASDLSILSSRSVIEYDGVFYWWNVDRPLMFNGVVREIPNMMNINYFLDNLNFAQRQKVFAYKVPRFGEIWWCFPFGDATECTHAVIYNVREQTWYDTQLPGIGRSSGISAQVYNKPFMVDLEETATGFTLWQHETGTDEVNGSNVESIESYFVTADISMVANAEPADAALRVSVVEPDFIQSGDMTVQITGKANARAPEIVSTAKTFVENDGSLDAENQLVRFKENRREMRFKFSSNAVGGDYQAGQSLAHIEPSDGRQTT